MKKQYDNAFGPVPGSFERSVQQALRQTKEVKPVKRFSVRTAALALSMLVCLIAVCGALTQQPEDKVAASPTPQVTGSGYSQVEKTTLPKDVELILAGEYTQLDANAVSWQLGKQMTIDWNVGFKVDELIYTADAVYLTGSIYPMDIQGVVLMPDTGYDAKIMHAGEAYTSSELVKNGCFVYEAGYNVLALFDKDRTQLLRENDNPFSVYYDVHKENGAIPVVIKMAGNVEVDTLKECELQLSAWQLPYNLDVPKEYAFIKRECGSWYIALAPGGVPDDMPTRPPSYPAQADEKQTMFLQDGTMTVDHKIEFRIEQVVCVEDAYYYLGSVSALSPKTVLMTRGQDIDSTLIYEGKETTYARLLQEGFTVYRVSIEKYADYTSDGIYHLVSVCSGGIYNADALWTDGSLPIAIKMYDKNSMINIQNYTLQMEIWLAECDAEGNVIEDRQQNLNWYVPIFGKGARVEPTPQPELVTYMSVVSYMANRFDLDHLQGVTGWDVNESVQLTPNVRFTLEQAAYLPGYLVARGTFSSANAGDAFIQYTDYTAAEMLEKGFSVYKVNAENAVVMCCGKTISMKECFTYQEWLEEMDIVFVFEVASDVQTLQMGELSVQLECAEMPEEKATQTVTLSLSQMTEEEMLSVTPTPQPARTITATRDFYYYDFEERMDDVKQGNYMLLGDETRVWKVQDEITLGDGLTFKIEKVVWTPLDFFFIGHIENTANDIEVRVFGMSDDQLPENSRVYYAQYMPLALVTPTGEDLLKTYYGYNLYNNHTLMKTSVRYTDENLGFIVGVQSAGVEMEKLQQATLRMSVDRYVYVMQQGEIKAVPGDILHAQWDVDLMPVE